MADMKDEILHVAIERMQKVGIRSVSVDDLCHALGISKKTFYVYFASKDALVEAILSVHGQKVAHELSHAVQKRTVIQVIKEWAKIAKHTEKSMVKTPPMMYDLEKYYPKLFVQHKQFMRQITEEILVCFLQKGIAEGFFRKEIDVRIVAMVFMDIQYKLMDYVSEGKKSQEEIRHIGHQGMDLLMRGILTVEGLEILRGEMKQETTI